jgi:hypothetical protein
MQDLGASFLLISRDQGTMGDAYQVIQAILKDPKFRQRASTLSLLVRDLPDGQRLQACRALIQVMLSKHDPPEDAPKPTDMQPTTAAFATFVGFVAVNGRWGDHVHGVGDKGKTPTSVRVSSYLVSLIRVFEDMWGVRGLLKNGPKPAGSSTTKQ